MADAKHELSKQRPVTGLWIAGAVLTVAFLWCYWPTLQELVATWARNSQYSHGFLVPLLAAGLLWLRRDQLRRVTARASLWGLLLVLAAAALRLGGTYYYYLWFDQVSIVLCLAGLCLLLGGWQFFRWCVPALVLLAFMVPLPYRAESALGWPLQRVATESSSYLLQTAGLQAVPQGNVIYLGEEKLEVAQACSGLRMLLSFLTLACAVALYVRRVWWQRLTIFASAVPIALVCNVLRITATGMLIPWLGDQEARVFFHDVSGLLMMPLALAFFVGELYVLSHLLIEVELDRHVPVLAVSGGGAATVTSKG